MVKKMAKEYFLGLMELNLLENLVMIIGKVLVLQNMPMVMSIKEVIKIIKNMARVVIN